MYKQYENRDLWIFRAFVFSFMVFVFFTFNSTENNTTGNEVSTTTASIISYTDYSAILVSSTGLIDYDKLSIASKTSFVYYVPNFEYSLSLKRRVTNELQKLCDSQVLNHMPAVKKLLPLLQYSPGKGDDTVLIS